MFKNKTTIKSPRISNDKNLFFAYFIWFFLGVFGVHRFYVAKNFSGLIMLTINLLACFLTITRSDCVFALPVFSVAVFWFYADAVLMSYWPWDTRLQ